MSFDYILPGPGVHEIKPIMMPHGVPRKRRHLLPEDVHSPERTYFMVSQLSHVVGGGSFLLHMPSSDVRNHESLLSWENSLAFIGRSWHGERRARRVEEQGGRGPVGSGPAPPRSRIEIGGTIGHRIAVL